MLVADKANRLATQNGEGSALRSFSMSVKDDPGKVVKCRSMSFFLNRVAATPAADLVIKAGPDRLSSQPYAHRHRLARARARIGAALGVIVSLGSLCCESAGDKFDVYYPTALGQRGSNIRYSPGEMGQTLFPAIRLFPKAHRVLEFVMIAAQDKKSGSGQTILDGRIFSSPPPIAILLGTRENACWGSCR